MTRLITDCESRCSTPDSVFSQEFLSKFNMELLRSSAARPPLVPSLKSEVDTSYFDDFDTPQEMSGYSEINKRAKEMSRLKRPVAGLRESFVGFTFKHRATPAA